MGNALLRIGMISWREITGRDGGDAGNEAKGHGGDSEPHADIRRGTLITLR